MWAKPTNHTQGKVTTQVSIMPGFWALGSSGLTHTWLVKFLLNCGKIEMCWHTPFCVWIIVWLTTGLLRCHSSHWDLCSWCDKKLSGISEIFRMAWLDVTEFECYMPRQHKRTGQCMSVYCESLFLTPKTGQSGM